MKMTGNLEIRLMDKKEGETSFSSLYSVKKENRGKKVGHAGTLDKFASGLMIVLIGNGTKLNPVFSSFSKSYRALVRFGEETDTLDPEGTVIKKTDCPSEREIREILPSFLGPQMQRPPLYSALHVGGRRAYEIARSGKEVVMDEREITIHDIRFISYDGRDLDIEFSVSKGTYIRSIARDLGLRLSSSARLEKLRRLSIGPYTLSDLDLDTMEILEKSSLFSSVEVDAQYRKVIENGYIPQAAIISDSDEKKEYKILSFSTLPYAIGKIENGRLRRIALL